MSNNERLWRQGGHSGKVILDARGFYVGEVENPDDAAHIVTVVNERHNLVKALGCFLNDPRFQVAVGGNPHVVDIMPASARATYEAAGGK